MKVSGAIQAFLRYLVSCSVEIVPHPVSVSALFQNRIPFSFAGTM